MDLQTYLSTRKQRAFAEALGVTQGLISQWARRKALPPPERCVAIERFTGGAVRRQDLRPSDWREIWPELEPADQTSPAEAAPAALQAEGN